MSNSSLLKCAAAFMVLSVYIWLFGITGVIDDDSAVAFADESLEFIPAMGELADNNNEESISAGGAEVNPVNDPKPSFADFPAQTSADYFNYQGSALTAVTSSPPSTAPNETAAQTLTSETMASTTATTTPSATTTEAASTTAAATSAPVSESEPAKTTSEPQTDSETSVNPALTQKLTVITSNGEKTDTALNIVSKIVQNEIGSSFDPEAIKAQAVAAYTYVILRSSQGVKAQVELSNAVSERVTDCVKEVLGQALYYDGNYIQAGYFSSSAGYTASSENVWGTDFPYLRSVKCEFDMEYDPNQGLKTTMTSNEFKAAIIEKTGIQLTGDPSQWISIINYTDSVYVGSMTIGGHSSYNSNGSEIKFTGKILRDILGTKTLKSAAFDFVYNADTDKFTFTTYGYGHGVGMSQNGANILARYYGYDYKQILGFYYPGTTLK